MSADLVESISLRIQALEAEKQRRIEDFDLARARHESELAVLDAKMAKIWSVFEFLEDPLSAEVVRELVTGTAVQAGAQVPRVPDMQHEDDRHPGVNGVSLFIRKIPEGQPFDVDDIFSMSLQDRPSTERQRHPDWINKRKAFISVALGSLRKKGTIELTGEKHGPKIVYRRPVEASIAAANGNGFLREANA